MDRFEQLMEVNYYALVRCTKTVLPHMLRAKQGHIINVASIAGKIGTPKGAGYSASKHAVLGFTNSIKRRACRFRNPSILVKSRTS